MLGESLACAAAWLAGGLVLTLRAGAPAARSGRRRDNFVPFTTIGIYLANPGLGLLGSQTVGNLLLLLPLGLLGPIAVPWLDRWWRVLLVANPARASRSRSPSSRIPDRVRTTSTTCS